MVKRRFNKTQILKVLEEYDNGTQIQSIIKEYDISQATFYNWRAKYTRFATYSTQELKKLREDNERLKRMFADLSLENLSLKAQLEKHNL